MSHFRSSAPPDIVDTYSLLVLNIAFRTTADDLYPLFAKYGRVVDVFIPRDRRTGESRGFAFVRFHYKDEAQKAVDRLDGRVVDGREIAVQFAKYGPNAERIHKGRIIEKVSRIRGRSRSRSPRMRYHDRYRDLDYRRRSRSRSLDRYERDRYRRERNYRYCSASQSISPYYDRSHHSKRDRSCSRSPVYDEHQKRRSHDSASPPYHHPSPSRSQLSLNENIKNDQSPTPHDLTVVSRSPSYTYNV